MANRTNTLGVPLPMPSSLFATMDERSLQPPPDIPPFLVFLSSVREVEGCLFCRRKGGGGRGWSEYLQQSGHFNNQHIISNNTPITPNYFRAMSDTRKIICCTKCGHFLYNTVAMYVFCCLVNPNLTYAPLPVSRKDMESQQCSL